MEGGLSMGMLLAVWWVKKGASSTALYCYSGSLVLPILGDAGYSDCNPIDWKSKGI